MTQIGSAEFVARLALNDLLKDAQKAATIIQQQVKDQQVRIKPQVDGSAIANLARTLGSSYGEAQKFSQGLSLTAQQAQAAIERIRQLESVGATTAERYKALKSEFGLSAQQMYQLGNASKVAAQQIEAQAKAAQNSSQNIKALANTLGTNYKNARQFADGLGLTAQKANDAIANLRELDRVSASNATKFQILNRELGITRAQFDQLNIAAKQSNDGLQGIAASSGAVAAGIGAAFFKGTQDFIAFDSAIRQSGVIGQSLGTKEFEALRAEVERLGIVTSKSPAQIAQMSVSLSRAGFSAQETADSLLGIVRASEATGEDLESVGDIIAKTYRTFQKEFEKAGIGTRQAAQLVSDSLVQTANATNTSVSGLGESLKYVGAAAAGSNQPIQDVLILLGLLGDTGIQGSQAGTNLAQAMERLKLASAGNTSEFSDLVRGSAKMNEAFNIIGASVRNADGSMKSVLEVLPVIQANLKSLSQADQEVLMKSLFGVEGGRAFQALLNTTPERLALVTQQVRSASGAAEEAGTQLQQGLGGSLKLFQGSFETLSTKLGEFVSVGLEPAVRAATLLINTFLSAPAPLQATVIATTALVGAFSAAVAVITAYKLLQIQTAAALAAQTAAAIASAVATKGATAAQILFNTQITITQARLVATQAALAAAAIAKKAYAAATTGAAAASGVFVKSLLLIAPQLAAIAVAIGTIAFAKYANDLRSANESIEQLQQRVEASANGAFAAANRTATAIEKLNAARAAGRSLTEQEKTDAQNLVSANEERIRQLQEELKAAEALQASSNALQGENKEQAAARAALIQQIQTSIGALQGQNDKLRQAIGATNTATEATRTNTKAQEENASALDTVTSAYQKQIGEIENANAARLAEIKQGLADRKLSEEQANQQTLDQEKSFQQQRLALAQQQIEELRAIESKVSDPKEREKLNQQILEAERTVSDARLQIAQTAIAQREAIEQAARKREEEALQRLAKANQQAEAAISQSQQRRVAAVREAQLAGTKTAQEAEQAIAQIQKDASDQAIQLKERELAEIRKLRESGTISAEEAGQREIALNQQIGDLNLQRIEREIEARRRLAEEAINQQFAPIQLQQNLQADKQGLQAQELRGQNELLSAQQNLQSALAGLENARFDRQIEAARAAGDEVGAEQIKLQQIEAQARQQEEQFRLQQEQLKLQQEQRRLDLETEKTKAQIARTEAEIALARAQANGASAQEIANLQRLLNLQGQRVQQADAAIARQSQIESMQQQALDAQQQAGREQMAGARDGQARAMARAIQNAIQQRNSQASEGTGTGGNVTRSEDGRILEQRNASGTVIQRQISTVPINQAPNGLARQVQAQQPNLSAPTLAAQVAGAPGGDIASALRLANQPVVTELQGLRQEISRLAASPRSLYVSAPNPVQAAGAVLNAVSKQAAGQARL